MVRKNALKQRLRAGKKSIGCWLMSNNALAAEVLAHCGYDCLIADHEHGPGDFVGLAHQLAAIGASGPTTLARVPWNDPVYIKRGLDTGLEGIMSPMIESAAQAKQLVDACFYPPKGTRGCATGAIRATMYGADALEYFDHVNDNLLVIAQIETPKGVAAIEDIAAVDGIDMLLIGPTDLTVNMGGRPGTQVGVIAETIAAAERRILATGKLLGSVLFGGATPQQMFDRGYNLIIAGTEMSLLRNAAAAQIRAHREKNP